MSGKIASAVATREVARENSSGALSGTPEPVAYKTAVMLRHRDQRKAWARQRPCFDRYDKGSRGRKQQPRLMVAMRGVRDKDV